MEPNRRLPALRDSLHSSYGGGCESGKPERAGARAAGARKGSRVRQPQAIHGRSTFGVGKGRVVERHLSRTSRSVHQLAQRLDEYKFVFDTARRLSDGAARREPALNAGQGSKNSLA